jgi:hypothetical protein
MLERHFSALVINCLDWLRVQSQTVEERELECSPTRLQIAPALAVTAAISSINDTRHTHRLLTKCGGRCWRVTRR